MLSAERASRIAGLVGGVLRQALEDAGAGGLLLLDDGSPEARLARDWCESALGGHRFEAAALPSGAQPEAAWAALGAGDVETAGDLLAVEAARLVMRVRARSRGWITASAWNKTVLVLAGEAPPEPLLPLGDLYASQVEQLAGGWSAPAAVAELAERAGGIGRLDRALAALLDERRTAEEACAGLDGPTERRLLELLDRGRFARRRVGLVPKLGTRTLGADLF